MDVGSIAHVFLRMDLILVGFGGRILEVRNIEAKKNACQQKICL